MGDATKWPTSQSLKVATNALAEASNNYRPGRDLMVGRLFVKEFFVGSGKARSLFSLSVLATLASSVLPIGSSHADELRFAPLVQFKLASTFGAGDVGTLTTASTGKDIQMVLSNVAMSGTGQTQELQTEVDKGDLSLIRSQIYDVAKGRPIRVMERKTGTSIMGNANADLFVYHEYGDTHETTTEPHVEFKVVDFVSVILIAADAINRKDMQPIDLSMLRDRSVTRVILRITGQEKVGNRQGTVVRVSPPDNPTGGIVYTIAQTDDGSYFPARISAETSHGHVQLDGSIQ